MTGAQNKSVAVKPLGILGIVAKVSSPQGMRHWGCAKRQSGVTAVRCLDTINTEAADRIDAPLLKALRHGCKDTGGTLSQMRVLVTGAAGMLGTEMMSTDLHEAVGLSRAEFDIADPTASAELAAGTWGKFDAVINCAAYTAVDQAESERQLAYEVNALGPGYLGQAAVRLGARFFHVSTDFVFDGSATAPYQEEDRTNPLGVYGETKLLGEEAVRASGADWTIFRTAWLYGVHGKCFPRSILNAYLAKRSLKVVDDQIGSPTSASELAKVIWMALDRKIMPGIYHAAGPQAMSWHGVAERVVQAAGGDKSQIARIATSDWPTPAVRPKYSVLNSSKLEQAIGYQMKTDAIEQFVAEANA